LTGTFAGGGVVASQTIFDKLFSIGESAMAIRNNTRKKRKKRTIIPNEIMIAFMTNDMAASF